MCLSLIVAVCRRLPTSSFVFLITVFFFKLYRDPSSDKITWNLYLHIRLTFDALRLVQCTRNQFRAQTSGNTLLFFFLLMLFSSLSLRLTQRKLFLLQIKTRVSFFSFSIILNTKKINKLLRKSAANENVLFMLSLPQLFFSLEMLHNVYSIYDFSDLNTASNQAARQCNQDLFPSSGDL